MAMRGGGKKKEKPRGKKKKVDLPEGLGGKSLLWGVSRRRDYFPPSDAAGGERRARTTGGAAGRCDRARLRALPPSLPPLPPSAAEKQPFISENYPTKHRLREPLLHILIIGIISREFRKQQ